MKCQSDYDKEEQALVRQADDCVQEWWEGESPSVDARPSEAKEGETGGIVEAEAIKRGLVKQS